MKKEEAIRILEEHQKWRLGKTDIMTYSPIMLTNALDIVLDNYEKQQLEIENLKVDMEGFAKFINYDYWYSEKRGIWCEDDMFKLIDDCKKYTFDQLYQLYKESINK
jgi:hypothetical protein